SPLTPVCSPVPSTPVPCMEVPLTADAAGASVQLATGGAEVGRQNPVGTGEAPFCASAAVGRRDIASNPTPQTDFPTIDFLLPGRRLLACQGRRTIMKLLHLGPLLI